MKGVLLAAGRGTRLRPQTDTIPKPLLKVGGKPILTWIIEGLRNAGIQSLSIIVGHLADQIEAYYGDGSALGVSLRFHHQTVRNGTARAVLPAAGDIDNTPFFLGYGDILVDPVNYIRLTAFHRAHPDDAVITGWPSDTPWTGGVLQVQRDARGHRLTGLVEKPPKDKLPGNLINAGLMILQPEILHCIRQVRPSPRGEYELTDALLDYAQRYYMHVMTIESFWSDIGTPEKLAATDAWFQDHHPSQGMGSTQFPEPSTA